MRYLKTYSKFESNGSGGQISLAHGFSGGSGSLGFGLDKNPNYGSERIPNTMNKQHTSFLHSDITGEYYDDDDIKKMFNNYLIQCRINQEEPIVAQISDLTAATFDEIVSKS